MLIQLVRDAVKQLLKPLVLSYCKSGCPMAKVAIHLGLQSRTGATAGEGGQGYNDITFKAGCNEPPYNEILHTPSFFNSLTRTAPH